MSNIPLAPTNASELPEKVIAYCGPYYGQPHSVIERKGRYVTIARLEYQATVHITDVDLMSERVNVRKEAA